jgi:hypothetical protein
MNTGEGLRVAALPARTRSDQAPVAAPAAGGWTITLLAKTVPVADPDRNVNEAPAMLPVPSILRSPLFHLPKVTASVSTAGAAGVMVTGADELPEPTAFTAATVTAYEVPFARPFS